MNPLNLSHNLLTGFDQHPVISPWTCLDSCHFRLRSNKLQEALPIHPVFIKHYLLSNKKLTGVHQSYAIWIVFISAICLTIIFSLGNFSSHLSVLKQGSKFHRSIPQTLIDGTEPRMIDLSHNLHNLFQGRVPRWLTNCTMLEFLDLGDNQIAGIFSPSGWELCKS